MDTTELFDGTAWVPGPNLPERRYSHGCVAYHSTKVVIFSGADFGVGGISGYLSTTYEYDFAEPAAGWVQKADIPNQVYFAAFGT